MASSKKRYASTIIALIAGAAVVLGIVFVNDDYNKRYFACSDKPINSQVGAYAFTSCVSVAQSEHDKYVNQGWAFIIVGTIVGLASLGTASSSSGNNKKH